MKATIVIDCSPDELREFMGLPNVKPMQESLMKDIETRMKDAADRMSPENIIKSWFSMLPQQSEQFRSLLNAMMTGSMNQGGVAANDKDG